MNLNEETEGSATAPGLAAVLSTVILLVTYVLTTIAVVVVRGPRPDRRVRGRRRHLRRAGRRRARLAAGQARGDSRSSLSALSSTQTTILPGVAHHAVDGAPGGVPGGVRTRAPALPHAARVHDRDRRDRLGVVRGAVPAVRELRLRLAHGAGVHDRLLLRAHGLRLRDLLPPRAHQVGEELPLHRRGAGDRRADPRLPVLQGHRRVPRSGRPPTRAARSSGRRCRSCSASGCCCSGWS